MAIGIGIGISLTQRNRRGGGVPVFSPAALFANGESGAWFDPGPATCFTDTARTVPASVGQSVASMTDLSGRGNHATQVTASSRPVLMQAATGEHYLSFSGSNVFMQTQNIDLSGTDKISLFAGAITRGLSGTIINQNNTLNPSFRIFNNVSDNWRTQSVGVNGNMLTEWLETPASPFSSVVSNIVDHAVPVNQLRVSGIVREQANIGGGGAFANAPLFIGQRSNGTERFTGDVFSLIVRGALTDLALIGQTEQYVASKTAGSIL